MEGQRAGFYAGSMRVLCGFYAGSMRVLCGFCGGPCDWVEGERGSDPVPGLQGPCSAVELCC